MIIVAKYPSTCPVCSEHIVTGSRVHWQKGQKAIHVACRLSDKAPTARDKTLSLFDSKTDLERDPWQGRDGSFSTRVKKPRVFKPNSDALEWLPNREAPGIADSWRCKEGRIDWERTSNRFHTFLLGVHVHTSDTLAEAIQFAEREMVKGIDLLTVF